MTQPEIEAYAKAVSGELLEERSKKFRDDPSEANKALLRKATQVHSNLERVRKIAESARSEEGMSVNGPADFDRDPMQLCVENGILDLETGKLLEARPDHMVSKLAGTHFDAAAKAPMFEQFLLRIQPDPEIRAFLRRAVGYTLTGLVDEEKLFFMFGTGANGKSVFANIIAAVLGEYAASLGTPLVAKNKHENEAERLKARLPGLRLALVNETAQGDIWDDQRIKELASRERLSARLLHREAFDFMPTHKLWIRGNHLPGVLDPGHGFWRRMVPIHFGVQIDQKEMIQDLDRKIIEAELPGILNWALKGCREWRRSGLNLPASIRAFTKEYHQETDLLGMWLDERCQIRPEGEVPVRDAYISFNGFCVEQGVGAWSQMAFSRGMTSRGFRRHPDTSVRRFVGFSLRSDDQPDDEKLV